MSSGIRSEHRVLVLCPTGPDADLATRMLHDNGIDSVACDDFASLVDALRVGAGAVVVAEEALSDKGLLHLQAELRAQPPWSDIPLLLLARPGADSLTAARVMELLGNVTILERPARIAALVSAVRAALRARTRQY